MLFPTLQQTYLCGRFRIDPNSRPKHLRVAALKLLAVSRRILHRSGLVVDLEEMPLDDMYEARFPRPVLARVAATINTCRRFDEPVREPGRKELGRYMRFYGGLPRRNSIVISIPHGSEEFENDAVAAAYGDLRATLDELEDDYGLFLPDHGCRWFLRNLRRP